MGNLSIRVRYSGLVYINVFFIKIIVLILAAVNKTYFIKKFFVIRKFVQSGIIMTSSSQ